MTSNIGSQLIQEAYERINDSNKDEILEQVKRSVFNELKKTIRPEFLNRIDETIMFSPLTKENMKAIVKIQFNRIIKRLQNKDIKIEISESAVDWLSVRGYDPQFGARPVERLLQKYVLNELSKRILSGEISTSKNIKIDLENDKLKFVSMK